MLRSIITAGLIAASAAIAFSPSSAFAASKLEKVDMVKEGIDLAPIIVKANSNGYSGYVTSSHKYMLRVFAKGKGSNHVYFGGITSHKGAHPMEVGWPWFFSQQAPNGNDGWGVFKKSLAVNIGVSNTNWITRPSRFASTTSTPKWPRANRSPAF